MELNAGTVDVGIGRAVRVGVTGVKVAAKGAGKAAGWLGRLVGIGGKELSKEAQASIRSLERLIAEHKKKLAEFRANPTPRPGTEGLSKEIQQKSIEGRIRHLEKEIETAKNNIEKIRRGAQ